MSKLARTLAAANAAPTDRKARRALEKALQRLSAPPRPLSAPVEPERMHDACYLFECPTCRARVGEQCVGGKTHQRRINRTLKPKPGRGSVRAIPGGAFEMNRRRH